MDDTEALTLPIEEYAIPAMVPLNNPFPRPVALERRDEQVSFDSGSPYVACSYEFHDEWFRRDTPTFAARPRVAALISGVDVQAERRHGSDHLSSDAANAKSLKRLGLLVQT